MTKKFFYLVLFIVLMFSLFSCPDDVSTLTLISYNKDDQKYNTVDVIPVYIGESFGDVKRDPLTTTFVKEGFEYTFLHWSEQEPDGDNINTSGERYLDSTQINNNVTLYAVYQKTEYTYSITLKSFDSATKGYKEQSNIDGITYNLPFSEIPGGKPTSSNLDDVEGFKYTFKGWTAQSPTGTLPKTSEADFTDSTRITDDLTLYAVYQKGEQVKYTVTLKSFNKDAATPGYTELKKLENVPYNTALNTIAEYPTPADIEDFNGSNYTFLGWTKTETTGATPKTEGADFAESDKIKGSITLYAVYKSTPVKYTVTLKSFNGNVEDPGYTELKKLEDVQYNTTLNDNEEYQTPETIQDFKGKKYTFKGWSTTAGTTTPKIDGDDFALSNKITGSITLYAVYESTPVNYTVTLKSFNKDATTPGYTTTILEKNDVAYGTALKNIQGYYDAPVIEAFEGRKYTFKGWSTTAGAATPKTDGADFAKEQGVTASVILYAVYEGEDINITVKFMSYKNDESTQEYIDCINPQESIRYGTEFNSSEIQKPQDPDDVSIGGIKYSFVGWADVSDPQAILEEYNNTDVPGNTQIKENKTFYAIYKGDYLTFTAKEDTTVQFDIEGTLDNPISLQFRKEGQAEFSNYTWNESASVTSGTGLEISLDAGDKVYFKGENSTFSKDDENYVNFKSIRKVEASGSVMSLLNKRDTIPTPYCFQYFFYNAPLTTAPELPATNLTPSCYQSMFESCTLLEKAPMLPATSLTDNCYWKMFLKCTFLTQAPELPAKTLAEACYYNMFGDCTSLTDAPELPATEITESCYQTMFRGCTSLETAPALPAGTLNAYCYAAMFKGCTALKNAPILSAKTLGSSIVVMNCYGGMFEGCTSLTTAPELPATELTIGCYNAMFKGCTALKNAPSVLPAGECQTLSYSKMFEGCTSLETAPEICATNRNSMCYDDMFKNCSSLNYIKCLIIYDNSIRLDNWVQGVPEGESGTFVCKTAAKDKWVRGASGIPNGWGIDTVD